jgi:Nickel responsive protein SCO4226-like
MPVVKNKQSEVFMKRYVIERDIPGVGSLTEQQREGVAAKSNDALAKLNGKAQWIHSYVTGNKTFCIYLAEDEAAVREHAKVSGFPANKITEVASVIDPTTAR